ncbi:MAG: HEPN domain-containing protein [Acidimicrobiales bacterium]
MDELPDNDHDEARRWLHNIEEDLRVMRAVHRDPSSPARITCFLSHLVVEKALKAALIDASLPFKKTHDLVELYGMCRRAGRLPGLDETLLAHLTPWAIDGRYADDLREADRPKADQFASFAEQVFGAVRDDLATSHGHE